MVTKTGPKNRDTKSALPEKAQLDLNNASKKPHVIRNYFSLGKIFTPTFLTFKNAVWLENCFSSLSSSDSLAVWPKYVVFTCGIDFTSCQLHSNKILDKKEDTPAIRLFES